MRVYFKSGSSIRVTKREGRRLIDDIFLKASDSKFVKIHYGNVSSALLRLKEIECIK